jgi:hypothetical protein
MYLLVTLFLCDIPVAVCNLVSKTSSPTADYPVNAPFHELGLASSSKKELGIRLWFDYEKISITGSTEKGNT